MPAPTPQPIRLPTREAGGDAELVGRARDGDRFSREVLYRRHAAYLLGMTTRLLANRAEAEEVVQDTFAVEGIAGGASVAGTTGAYLSLAAGIDWRL